MLVVDEAGMIGSRQMERVLSAAQAAGAKVVLVGDPEQLQAIEAGAAFRALAERDGAAEITEVRRQREDWQRRRRGSWRRGARRRRWRATRRPGWCRGTPPWTTPRRRWCRAGMRRGRRVRRRARSCWRTGATTCAS